MSVVRQIATPAIAIGPSRRKATAMIRDAWGRGLTLNPFAVASFALVCLLADTAALAAQEVNIHVFGGGADGFAYGTDLLVLPNGTVYAVDVNGGRHGQGEVFRLSPPSGGTTWTKTSVYAFKGAEDGSYPFGRLVAGPNGSLYGTTRKGGATGFGVCDFVVYELPGCGTAFQLMPPAQPGSPWTKKTIFSFPNEGPVNAPAAVNPLGGLVIDSAGNLYGTTSTMVFELSPPVGAGGWTLSVLHSFSGSDGDGPQQNLLLDSHGNLFGSTSNGGVFGRGTVFQLIPNATGWAYQQIYDFEGAPNDGDSPNGGLRGEAGDIWGTTQAGGVHNAGTIFELRQEFAGSPLYTPIIHYTFSGGTDGGSPEEGLFEADDGSYWGTASQGGDNGFALCPSGCGVVFDLQRRFSRYEFVYDYSVDWSFSGLENYDGSYPYTSLGVDQNGSLYGVTMDGYQTGLGTIFQLPDAVTVLPTATPTFTPAAGTYASTQPVTIADATPGATIYYTTNGTAPTLHSSVYSGAITVSGTEQIRAIALAPGYTKSRVAVAKYTIEPSAAAPTFSPKAGTYTGSVAVSISDSTPGATIHFTTDGTNPTTSSATYSGTPIRVATTERIKAIAAASDFTRSPIAAIQYTITP